VTRTLGRFVVAASFIHAVKHAAGETPDRFDLLAGYRDAPGSRNGDAASIDDLGRCMGSCIYVKNSENRARRVGVPRPEQVGGRVAIVS
jgi:hypothetical protein